MASFGPQAASANGWLGERTAAIVFGIYLIAAIPILLNLGSHYWFKGDEWEFFLGPDITDKPLSLFRSVQGHWVTFPILVYRGLYTVFGLHSYLPFQLSLILLHLVLCCLLRAIMRGAGVGPWMATITASTFVLFGAGETNILAGIQISQAFAIVFVLSHLILANHNGRIDHRDWLGLICGLMCIMSSGLGPALVAIVGLAVVFRRGLRPALFHTLPLAAVFVVRMMLLPKFHGSANTPDLPSPWVIVRWVTYGESGVFLAIGGHTIVAVSLGVLLVTGLILAWAPLSRPRLRQQASVPAAMLIGAPVLLAAICTQRWYLGINSARADHYITACTVLTLPALAVAANAVVLRWRWMIPIVCILFLVSIRANISRFGEETSLRPPVAYKYVRDALLAAAYSPLADQAPAKLRPEPHGMYGGNVDMAFLIAARDSGRLPPPPKMTDKLKSQTELRLSVQQITKPLPESRDCARYTESISLNPEVGDIYVFKSPVRISLGESGAPLNYYLGRGYPRAIRILRPGLQLHFSPIPSSPGFGLCQGRT